MQLSEKERKVLSSIELNADKSIDLIKKETGYREHTIRYTLHRLLSKGVIKPFTVINRTALGFVEYNIFFSTGSLSQKDRNDFLRALMKEDSVTFVAAMGADFPFGIGVVSKDPFEVRELLNKLSKTFHGMFFEKSVSTQFSVTIYPRGYLTGKQSKTAPFKIDKAKTIEIDDLDDKILSAVAHIPFRSNRELAQKLGLPLSTLEFRLKRLKEKNVILGSLYAVDPSKIGMHIFKLIVYARGIDPELNLQLHKFCLSNPYCTLLFECFGSWDYEINVEVESPEIVVGIVQELYDTCGQRINTIKVLSKFRNLKDVSYPLHNDIAAILKAEAKRFS
jgi:DNA-binding Lrp family transcriptional regulator